MNAVTARDIKAHVVDQAMLAEDYPDTERAAVLEALLDVAPLPEWEYANLAYTHPDVDPDRFWQLVEDTVENAE